MNEISLNSPSLKEGLQQYILSISNGDEIDREIAHTRLAGTLSRMYAHGIKTVGTGISIEDALKDLKLVQQIYLNETQLNSNGGIA